MKCIKMAGFRIVKEGVACRSETPIRLDKLLVLMERNESYFYWLQPHDADVNAQVPAISINDKFYHPNLRLEKAIFRHVRLSRDLNNKELLEDGTPKLRIPVHLIREKVKSSIRFQDMPQKTAPPTSKRAAARGIGKDPAKSKINWPFILRNHEELWRALLAADDAQDRPGVCLVLSPRALVQDLQRAFELEFPPLASRTRFSLVAA